MSKEPNCSHKPTHRVSSHADIQAAADAGEAMASTYTCLREKCLAEATFWVQGSTGKTAVVVELPKRAS